MRSFNVRTEDGGPHSDDLAIRVVERREEAQPLDVVEMEMRQADVELLGPVLGQLGAQGTNARSRVEDEARAVRRYLDARRVAAGTNRLRPRRGKRAAATPDLDSHRRPTPAPRR